MRRLFQPAVGLMRRLRYARKFMLLGLLSLAAILYLQLNLLQRLQGDIDTTYREMQGLRVIAQFNRLIQLAQQHRGLSSGLLSGNADLAGAVATRGNEVERAFDELGALLPEQLRTQARWREVTRDWREIREHGLAWAARANTDRHTVMINKLLLLSTDASDATALSLLGDLGGHYLFDTLIKLPQYAEQLGQARAYGMAMLAKPSIGDVERLEMAGFLGHVQTTRALQQGNLEKVMLYAPELRSALGQADRRFDASLQEALFMIRRDILGEKLETSPQQYFQHMTALIDLCYASGEEVLAPALRNLIGARRQAAQQRLAQVAAVGTGGLLLFAYLAVGVYLTLTEQIRKVLQTLRAMVADSKDRAELVEAIAGGDLGREVQPALAPESPPSQSRHDEIGDLAVALYRMAETQQRLGAGFISMTKTLLRHQQEENMQDSHKSGLAEIAVCLRGDRVLAAMAQPAIELIAGHLGAAGGALYRFVPERQALALLASHALAAPPPQIALGHGVSGTAAQERHPILLDPVPAGYVRLAAASGAQAPAAVLAMPLLHDGRLQGLLELSSCQSFDEQQQQWLARVAEALAIAVDVDDARQRVHELLEQTQQQAEELHLQQEQLQQSNEELEERAALLQQQREVIRQKSQESDAAARDLLAKARQLEQVSTYKSEFLANMSHELRTPLNSMLILSSLLQQNKEGRLSEKQVMYAATIHGAGKDLLNLINDILDLSKIEAGRLEMQFSDVRIDDLVEVVRAMFQPVADHKGLALWFDVAPGLPAFLHSDEQRVLQILKNLLANALKFTPAGDVRLLVTPEPSGIAFTVRDSGIGIAAELHERIFHAFQQGDSATSRQYGGSGLGLSISRQLARKLGGDVTVSSAPGSGSAFVLHLPLRLGADMIAAVQLPVTPGAGPASAPPPALPGARPAGTERAAVLEQRTVLLVDDDIRNVFSLSAALIGKGMRVVEAGDGLEALAQLQAHPEIDIVLMDIMMPNMDGYTAMRRIRANELWRTLPMIALSAKAMPGDRQLCLDAGASDYIAKPVDLDQLFALMGVWLCQEAR